MTSLPVLVFPNHHSEGTGKGVGASGKSIRGQRSARGGRLSCVKTSPLVALSSPSPQGCSVLVKLAVSTHRVTLHRCKPGTLSVQNHLGKEPEAGPTRKLMLKVGVRGALEVEKEGTVPSVMRGTSSPFCRRVQGLQPPGLAPAESLPLN